MKIGKQNSFQCKNQKQDSKIKSQITFESKSLQIKSKCYERI